MTRRGTNWRSLQNQWPEGSFKLADGPHNCIAVLKPGSVWAAGYVYMIHAAKQQAEDAARRFPGRTIAMRRITMLCMIVFAPMLATLSACSGGVTPGDVVDNLLCRPTARIPCINAPDHAGGHAGQ